MRNPWTRLSRTKRLALILTATVLIAAAAAIAAWIVTSNPGVGKAKTGALQAISLETTGANVPAPAGVARPGDDMPVRVHVTNPDSNGDLIITDASFGTTSLTSSNQTACPISNVEQNNTVTGLNIPLPVGADQPIDVPGLLTLRADAPTNCQGIVFTINASGGVVLTASTP